MEWDNLNATTHLVTTSATTLFVVAKNATTPATTFFHPPKMRQHGDNRRQHWRQLFKVFISWIHFSVDFILLFQLGFTDNLSSSKLFIHFV